MSSDIKEKIHFKLLKCKDNLIPQLLEDFYSIDFILKVIQCNISDMGIYMLHNNVTAICQYINDFILDFKITDVIEDNSLIWKYNFDLYNVSKYVKKLKYNKNKVDSIIFDATNNVKSQTENLISTEFKIPDENETLTINKSEYTDQFIQTLKDNWINDGNFSIFDILSQFLFKELYKKYKNMAKNINEFFNTVYSLYKLDKKMKL